MINSRGSQTLLGWGPHGAEHIPMTFITATQIEPYRLMVICSVRYFWTHILKTFSMNTIVPLNSFLIAFGKKMIVFS